MTWSAHPAKARMLRAKPRGPRPRKPGKVGFPFSISPAESGFQWSSESAPALQQQRILPEIQASLTCLVMQPVETLLWLPGALLGLPRWLAAKESTCKAGDTGLTPGSERSPGEGNGNLLQYSGLENPMDRGPWRAIVHGVTKEADTT